MRVARIGRTSVDVGVRGVHERDGELLCTAEQTLVLIDVATRRRRRSPTTSATRACEAAEAA